MTINFSRIDDEKKQKQDRIVAEEEKNRQEHMKRESNIDSKIGVLQERIQNILLPSISTNADKLLKHITNSTDGNCNIRNSINLTSIRMTPFSSNYRSGEMESAQNRDYSVRIIRFDIDKQLFKNKFLLFDKIVAQIRISLFLPILTYYKTDCTSLCVDIDVPTNNSANVTFFSAMDFVNLADNKFSQICKSLFTAKTTPYKFECLSQDLTTEIENSLVLLYNTLKSESASRCQEYISKRNNWVWFSTGLHGDLKRFVLYGDYVN